MKYMGSKRALLSNGLGTLISEASQSADRVVDLFCGAGSVSWFAASQLSKRVLACDLQKYAVALAASVLERTQPTDWQKLAEGWLYPARTAVRSSKIWSDAYKLDSANLETSIWKIRAEELCGSHEHDLSHLVFRCYGGHYFSPSQALAFDAMLQALPSREPVRNLCLAAAIIAASNCVAAPGHTAQPFKATATAGKYLHEAWCRDPFLYASKALRRLCPLHSTYRGQSLIGDANQIAQHLTSNDLVFVDPPYSAVHYSRFYHVLETMARGSCAAVSGEGRYPPPSDRPKSLYSQKSKSKGAILDLLGKLSAIGCGVILTFPGNACSNGLSGEDIEQMAQKFFRVERNSIRSKFSTLGGNKVNRTARHHLEEFILVLTAT